MILFRVDTRLIHGQIIEAWLPFLDAKQVIVAHDTLVNDPLRQQIMSLAIPQRIQLHFVGLSQLPQTLQKYTYEKVLVLVESIEDLSSAIILYTAQQMLGSMPQVTLNIGNSHYGAQKKELCPHVYVNEDEWHILQNLGRYFPLEFRSIPGEKSLSLEDVPCYTAL